MTGKLDTDKLLAALDELDLREGDVIAALLRRAAELQRRRALTATELGELKQSLTGLVTVVDGVQATIARAEHVATPPAPGAPPRLDELEAQLGANAAEFDRLRGELHASVVALESENGGSHGSEPAPGDTHGRTFRLRQQHMKGTDVEHFQRMLSLRFAHWGVHRHISEHGEYDAATRLAAHAAAYGLGIETGAYDHGMTPEVRDLVRTPSRRTPEQITRGDLRREWLARLRKRYAHAKAKAKAKPSHNGAAPHGAASHAATPHADGLAAAIRAHGGHYEDIIIAEARRSKVPVSLVCAVMQIESSFRNVFGHDGVANPIKSIHGQADRVVTEALYKTYLHHRHLGEGCQGVGAMQLTSAGLQDRADQLGGCFKPGPNIRVGVELLAGNIRRLGLHGGVKAYNGSGDQAEKYANNVLDLAHVWHSRLEGHATGTAAGHNGHGGATGHAQPAGHPRTFRLTTPKLMSGGDVRAFQHVLNVRFDAWGIRKRVAEDGVYGIETRHAAHQVALGLGLAPAEYAKGITPAVRDVMRKPSKRTPQQRKRAASRRGWLAKLRKGAKPRKGMKAGSGNYPLGVRGKLIGSPGQGTHSFTAAPNNWQSDNAVDLGVPIGTPMIAIDGGRVVKLTPHAQDGSRFAGDAITIVGDHGNTYFYKHGVSSVKVGQRVQRGQQIGTSGSASGSPHLHLGVKHGDPRGLIGQHR